MNAQIAQLVEQRTENPRVTGSIPVLGIFLYDLHIGRDGRVAQVVEHLTFNQVVRGSNPRCFTFDFYDIFIEVFLCIKFYYYLSIGYLHFTSDT